MLNNAIDNPKLKAQTYKARFLEKGVVKYKEELVLIKPENLMKIAQDFKGAHVIIDHQDINENNIEEIVGYINNVWFNEEDGWAWCDFTVNNAEAINLINNGYSVSCAYIPEYTQGGSYHNIPYEREIIGGEAIHLAIVESPRYEDALIIKNSIKKKVMNIFKLKKEEKVENSVNEIELESLENSIFEIEGEQVPLSNMVEAYKNSKEEEKKEEEKKMNADDEVEVDGEMVKVSELASAYKAAKKAAKNAEEEEKKKAEEEKKNEEEEEKEIKKNSADFEKIKAAKEQVENGVEVSSKTKKIFLEKDAFAAGAARYGSPQKVVK